MEVINKQKEFFNSGRTKDVKFRLENLKILKDTIKRYEFEIEEALEKDLGKSSFEAYYTEIAVVYEEIDTFISNLKKWSEPKKVKTPIYFPLTKSAIHSEPRGTVLIVSPWNYPFNLVMMPLVGAIGAGNTCLIKMSSSSVYVEKVVDKIIGEAFSDEYIRVLKGGNKEVNEVIDSGVDHIFFTGSPSVGKEIMKRAAENLTPVTLELGGKSPCIVYNDANIKAAAKSLTWGKFLNSGQTCIAPDYVFVHKDVRDQLLKELVSEVKTALGEAPLENPNYPRIVNEKNFKRLISYLDDDHIFFGGEYNWDALKIEPTILINTGFEHKSMKSEIFGPILPIIEYSNLSEVVDYVNSKERPLACYVFTENNHVADRLISMIPYGGGCINDVMTHFGNNNMPFGGNGNSGMGNYHGEYSFETFSHKKSMIYKSSKYNNSILHHPFTRGKNALVRSFIK